MEPIRRRSTLWRVLLFFILITAFFDLVIMATMPKYKSASTPADIAKTDLAQDCPARGFRGHVNSLTSFRTMLK